MPHRLLDALDDFGYFFSRFATTTSSPYASSIDFPTQKLSTTSGHRMSIESQQLTDPPMPITSDEIRASQAPAEIPSAGEVPISHAGIDAAVRDELPPPPPPEPVTDQMGNLIPDHLAAGYQSAHVLFEKTYDHLYGIRDTLKEMLMKDSAVSQVTAQRVDNIFGSLAGIEKQLIIESLRETRGIQSKAAKDLGITERSLWHRVKKLSIDVARIKNSAG